MNDCDEPSMPLEEPSTSEVDLGEIDALIANFETLSNTTVQSRKERQSGLWLLGRSLDRT